MAVRTKDELLTVFSEIVGDDSRDEVIQYMEDLSDTYDEMANSSDSALSDELNALKEKYEKLDKEWREKYRDRFLKKSEESTEEKVSENEGEENKKSYEYKELFKEEKGV